MDCALSSSGDLAADSSGLPFLVSGREEIAQQLYIALSAKKGCFLYDRELGSRLGESETISEEQALALARDALRPVGGAEVLWVRIQNGQITVCVLAGGEQFEVGVRR